MTGNGDVLVSEQPINGSVAYVKLKDILSLLDIS